MKQQLPKCSRTGCKEWAAFRPCFHLFAHAHGEPAVAIIDLPICPNCKEKIKLDDLLNDENWISICASFIEAGKAQPIRALTKLDFIVIPG